MPPGNGYDAHSLVGSRPTAGNVANCLPKDRIKIGQSVNECVHSYALAHNYQLSCPIRVCMTHMDCWDAWGAVGESVRS